MNKSINFRCLEANDLELLYKWLNKGVVTKWYNKGGSSYEQVESKYLPRVRGDQPTHSYVIVYDNVSIGYIQTYLIDDYPDYSQYVQSSEPAAGLDLFIGESEFIHKGLGSLILREFLTNYVFRVNKVDYCIIGPEPMNKVAIRAYEKIGFKYYKTIQVPGEDEPEYLMKLYKNDI